MALVTSVCSGRLAGAVDRGRLAGTAVSRASRPGSGPDSRSDNDLTVYL